MNTFVIARLTFQEAVLRRVLLAALVLGLMFLAIYGLGFNFINAELQREESSLLELREIRSFLLLAGLYVVNFLTVIMTVLTSVDTLAGEIGSGTIHTLASKPIRRWEIVLGKWLGFGGMMSLYLLMMGGGVMLLVYLMSGHVAPNAWRGLGLIWLSAMLLLSVSLLGGTMISTLANGVLVLGLYGIAFIGGWVEQIGSFLQNETAINVGIVSGLILPSEVLWKRAVYEMQSPLVSAIGFSPLGSSSVPSPVMIGYAVLYLLFMLGMAMRQFHQRDL